MSAQRIPSGKAKQQGVAAKHEFRGSEPPLIQIGAREADTTENSRS
jgi:hypothetical protein